MENDPTSPPASPLPSPAPSTIHIVLCPLCHTAASLTDVGVDSGEGWRCSRCGQQWDAKRLIAVTAYERWVRDSEQAPAPLVSRPRHLRLLRSGT